ncbi:hypothetical protein [Nostoc sp.]
MRKNYSTNLSLVSPHSPLPTPHSPLPNSQVHTNILKEFEYLVRQFGIS